MSIILASQSPRRKQLMAMITPNFEVCVSHVDESTIHQPNPAELVKELARAKCAAVAADHPADTVIGCDTVVDLNGTVLGKPASDEDACRMLRALSGHTHKVHTGVCIMRGGIADCFVHTSTVEFYPLTEEEITSYVATGEPADKAGAYAIQGGAALFCRRITGDYFSIMGLPVSLLARHLKRFGA